MYIVAIAWLYVALMISAGASTVFYAILSFVFYGLLPLSLFLWLLGTPARLRKRRRNEQATKRTETYNEQ